MSFAVPTSSKLDTCEVTGFESRVREECEEVSEVECTPIEVKKIKTEIREKCEVKLNKTCEVQFSPAPTEKCHPTTKRRSHHIYYFHNIICSPHRHIHISNISDAPSTSRSSRSRSTRRSARWT